MKRPQRRLLDIGMPEPARTGGARSDGAEVISLRPKSGSSAARDQDKAYRSHDPQLLEICRAWSKVTRDDPKLLMNGIFSAYWHGAYDMDGKSAIFQWISKKEDRVNVWPCRDLFLFLAGLERLSGGSIFDPRFYQAHTREPSEDEMRAMAAYPISAYPSDFVAIWLPELHIVREPFAAWYSTSSLSAGAPLESFLPNSVAQAAHVEAKMAVERGVKRKANSGRKPRYTPAQLAALRSGTFRLLEEYGDPESDNPHIELKSKADLIKALQEWAVTEKPKDFRTEPARATIQDDVNGWLEEWRTQRTAGN